MYGLVCEACPSCANFCFFFAKLAEKVSSAPIFSIPNLAYVCRTGVLIYCHCVTKAATQICQYRLLATCNTSNKLPENLQTIATAALVSRALSCACNNVLRLQQCLAYRIHKEKHDKTFNCELKRKYVSSA